MRSQSFVDGLSKFAEVSVLKLTGDDHISTSLVGRNFRKLRHAGPGECVCQDAAATRSERALNIQSHFYFVGIRAASQTGYEQDAGYQTQFGHLSLPVTRIVSLDSIVHRRPFLNACERTATRFNSVAQGKRNAALGWDIRR